MRQRNVADAPALYPGHIARASKPCAAYLPVNSCTVCARTGSAPLMATRQRDRSSGPRAVSLRTHRSYAKFGAAAVRGAEPGERLQPASGPPMNASGPIR